MSFASRPATSGSSRTRNYLLGLGSGYVFTIATVVVGLWLTPFTLRFLDREQFAIFTLAADVLMWLTLLDFGISSALRIQAAHLTGRPDPATLNRLASTAFFAELGVVLAVLAVGAGLALLFPHFYPVRPDLQRDATLLILLLVVGTAMSLGTQTFSALLVAHQQVHVDNSINLLNLVTRTVLTVVLLKAGWGLYSLGLSNLAAKATTSLFAVFRTYRLLPGLHIRWRNVSWEVLKATGRIGIWFTLGGLAGILIMSLDRLITGKLISVEMVATLSLTGRLCALAATLIEPVTNTARPMFGQLFGQQKWKEAERAYQQVFTLSTSAAVVMAAAICSANAVFVQWWVGGQNYGGLLLDLALGLKLLANCWVLANRAVLSANLLVRPQVLCRLVEGAVSVCLSVILARSWGVVGIVFGTAIASFATSVWYLPLLTARLFKLPLWHLLRTGWRLVLLLSCLCVVVPFSRELATKIAGFPGAAVGGVLTAGCGTVAVWLLVLDANIRGQAQVRLNHVLDLLRQPAVTGRL